MSETIKPTTVPSAQTGNPYVGPRTFTREQAHLFFGRDREAEELFSRVVSQRLVLFYAQSGAGKSSLLNTKLIPQLEGAGFVVLPVARVGGDLLGGVDERIDNIYLFNLMLSLDQSQRDPSRLASLTLPHFLDRLTTDDGRNWFYDETERSQLTVTHSALPIIPPSPNYVLIIDQFEEILTTHNDRWHERAPFFEQLEAAMSADPSLWVVLTLREDFVAGLDPYAHLLSDNLRARYYMQRMGVTAAKAAISQPAAQAGRPFETAAVDLLVNNLSQVRVAGRAGTEAGQYIEPVQLQVVCYQLWERLASEKKPGISKDSGIIPTASTPELLPQSITIADVQTAGDVDHALATFYETTIAAALLAHPLPGGERRLRRWFEDHLITEAGTRGTVYQGESETADLPNALVRALADRFLLRIESRAGGRWVELTHDRFVEPIVAANRAWETTQNNPLTAVTRLWLANDRDPARLLSGQQLRDAESYVQSAEQALSTDETAFLEASRQAEAEAAQQRHARSLWRTVKGVALLALVALVVMAWALQQRNQAVIAQKMAQIQADLAAKAQIQAQNDRDLAFYAKASADAANEQAQIEARAAAMAQAEAESANAQAQQLRGQIEADRIAQIGALAYPNSEINNTPQRGLLYALEAANLLEPPLPSALTIVHDLLRRTGGVGFAAFADTVSSVAFSNHEDMLAASSYDGATCVWSLNKTNKKPFCMHHKGFSITSLKFDPQDELLVGGGDDGVVRLWSLDALDTTPIELHSDESRIRTIAFSPNGERLASAGDSGIIMIWSLAEKEVAPIKLSGHRYYVNSLSFSPDGKWLASGGFDETVRLWSLTEPTAEPILLTGHSDPISSVAFSPDGQRLASGSWDHSVRLWSLSTPTADPVVARSHTAGIIKLVFAPDANSMIGGSSDGMILIWSLSQIDSEPIKLFGHDELVTSIDITGNGLVLATASTDMTVRLWSLKNSVIEPALIQADPSKSQIALSPSGEWLASGGGYSNIRLLSLVTPRAEWLDLQGPNALVDSMAFSPDGLWLASAEADGVVRVWSMNDVAAGPIPLTGHNAAVQSVSFSPSGQFMASGDSEGMILLWTVTEQISDAIELKGHEDSVNSVAFSPDGVYLASGSHDGTLRLWTPSKPGAESTVLFDDRTINSVAFSPDGQLLAAAGLDATIRIWTLPELENEPKVLHGHDGSIATIAFSPDSKILATGSQDMTIHLWAMDDIYSDPTILYGYNHYPESLVFTPDGKKLVSSSWDNEIKFWTVDFDNLFSLACQVAGRNLTQDEWRAAFGDEPYRRTCPQWPAGR